MTNATASREVLVGGGNALTSLVTISRAVGHRLRYRPSTVQQRFAQRVVIREVKRLLETPATARLPVAEIASRVGCSMFHLCRTFRRSEGKTISAYRAELRLSDALRRLREAPDIDLTELALECGYCSHSHLTASFRKALGTTPSAFRRGACEDFR